jgi:hypothetical protein
MSQEAAQSPLLLKLKVPAHRLKVALAASTAANSKKRARNDASSSIRSSPPASSPAGSLADPNAAGQVSRAPGRKKGGPKRKPKAAGLTEVQQQQQQAEQAQGDARQGNSKLGPRLSLIGDLAGTPSSVAAGRQGSPAVGPGNATSASGGHAMSEGYRLLDRSGSKCRRWTPSRLIVQSISGQRWHAASWAPRREPAPSKDATTAMRAA